MPGPSCAPAGYALIQNSLLTPLAMHSNIQRKGLFAAAAALAATTASAQTTLFSDSFEVDTSGDYTIVDDSIPDGTQAFAFDYIAAGIPAAPRSGAGEMGGLRLTANDTLTMGDAFTLFHNTPVNEDRYRVTVDVWSNFMGTTGSTEFAHVGVGGDGATFNSLFSPISGSGAFIAFTGDGGSSSDFRWFRDASNSPVGDGANTTLPNSHPSYLGHGSNGSGAFFQSLFPEPPSTNAGSPGNIWTTLEIVVDNTAGVISFSFDGQLTFRGDFLNDFNGLVSLGHVDAFSSLSLSNNFTLYDNLLVESLPAIGAAYCPAVANSTGSASVLVASGADVVASNDFTIHAQSLPLNTFGFFLVSSDQDFMPMNGGSDGNLCVGAMGANIGRGFGGAIVNSGPGGVIALSGDLASIPQPGGPVPTMVGDTWNFQCWYRDVTNGSASSNFSNGLEVTFN